MEQSIRNIFTSARKAENANKTIEMDQTEANKSAINKLEILKSYYESVNDKFEDAHRFHLGSEAQRGKVGLFRHQHRLIFDILGVLTMCVRFLSK